jgi:biotin carboxylase
MTIAATLPSVLIADRGEIACRIIRTARRFDGSVSEVAGEPGMRRLPYGRPITGNCSAS